VSDTLLVVRSNRRAPTYASSVDSSRPDLVDGFTRKTFTAMIEGVRESALEAGITEPEAFDTGIRDLYRTAEADGVFCYTFFKGVGKKT
jgi:hypothetical protein